MVELHLLVELGVQLREEPIVSVRARAGKAHDLVLQVRLIRCIDLYVNFAVLEVVPAIVVVQLVAEALGLRWVVPVARQPPVGRVLIDKLFALAPAEALDVELLQFGGPAALGSVEGLLLIVLGPSPASVVERVVGAGSRRILALLSVASTSDITFARLVGTTGLATLRTPGPRVLLLVPRSTRSLDAVLLPSPHGFLIVLFQQVHIEGLAVGLVGRVGGLSLSRQHVVAPGAPQVRLRVPLDRTVCLEHALIMMVVKALVLEEGQVGRLLETFLHDLLLEPLECVVAVHLYHEGRAGRIELRLQQALR